MNHLKKRGKAIISGDYDKMGVQERKLASMINQKYELYRRPVMAFVTFKSQEGLERCFKNALTVPNFRN